MTRAAFVLDPSPPAGPIANTGATLAMSLGRALPGLVGAGVLHGDRLRHPGVTTVPLPILAADAAGLGALRARAGGQEAAGLRLVDATETARRERSHEGHETEPDAGTAAEARA